MITFINPNLIFQRNDVFTTGVVYMPVSLAYFVATVRGKGYECGVIDAFGENPNQYTEDGVLGIRGLTPAEVTGRIDEKTSAVVVYAGNITYHSSLIKIIKAVRAGFPSIPVIVMENTQAVTAYSLHGLQNVFYDAGADYIITGEAEERGIKLLGALRDKQSESEISKIDGIGFRKEGKISYSFPEAYLNDLDSLPFPAWDLFPLQNYFWLRYAHGPLKERSYLPILTSRGCPYQCRFCIIPEMNRSRWRFRSARNVVDEMEHHLNRYGVREFHVEDVNPTVSDRRIREICDEIISRDLKLTWKLVSGTKVETIKNEETLEKMAEAGCRYISISPETGSSDVLKSINKPFDLDHAVKMIKEMNKVGIRSQACFVLGFPGENDLDRQMTRDLIRRLTKVGVDEIALFIISPVPGSAIFENFHGYDDYSQLNFSPEWRTDYEELNKFRVKLYRDFLLLKLCYHPWKVIKQCINFLSRRFETKMEMVPYRALCTFLMMNGLNRKREKYEN